MKALLIAALFASQVVEKITAPMAMSRDGGTD